MKSRRRCTLLAGLAPAVFILTASLKHRFVDQENRINGQVGALQGADVKNLGHARSGGSVGLPCAAVIYIIPSPTIYALAGVQVALFAVFRVAAKGKKPKGWGIVYDEMTRQPLHNAP